MVAKGLVLGLRDLAASRNATGSPTMQAGDAGQQII